MVQCLECGEELNPDAPFCPSCGAAVDADKKPSSPKPAPAAQETAPKPKPIPAAAPEPSASVAQVEVPSKVVAPSASSPISGSNTRSWRGEIPWWVWAAVAAVCIIAIFASQPGKQKEALPQPVASVANPPSSSQESTSSPVASKPTISLRTDEPKLKGSTWVATVYWEIKEAESARIKSDSFDEPITVLASGQRDISLGADPIRVTISATSGSEEATSSVTCKAIPKDSEASSDSTQSVGNASDSSPSIIALYWRSTTTDDAHGSTKRYYRVDNPDVAIQVQDNSDWIIYDGATTLDTLKGLVSTMRSIKASATGLAFQDRGVRTDTSFGGLESILWSYEEKSNKTTTIRAMRKHFIVSPIDDRMIMTVTEIRPKDAGTQFDEEIAYQLKLIEDQFRNRVDPL